MTRRTTTRSAGHTRTNDPTRASQKRRCSAQIHRELSDHAPAHSQAHAFMPASVSDRALPRAPRRAEASPRPRQRRRRVRTCSDWGPCAVIFARCYREPQSRPVNAGPRKSPVVVPLWGREPSALWCEPAFRRLEGSLRPQSTQRALFGTRRRGEVLWRRPSREHTRRGAPPANPRQQGRYDKTPAGDADEGPVKRKAQADEPGPYEAPQVRCRRYESGL